jgi:hypothetical protein
MFTLVTVLRSVRADFAPEIWKGLGLEGKPDIFTRSEILVGLGVVLVNGLCCLIADNRRAFTAAMAVCLGGLGLILLSLAGQDRGLLSPFAFLVLIGLGLYLPYVAFHTTIFERLIAMTRERGTIAYLMALADAFGYLGYVGVLMARDTLAVPGDFLGLFRTVCLFGAVVSILLVAASWFYFAGRRSPRPAAEAASTGA